jgi:hypothetical protein
MVVDLVSSEIQVDDVLPTTMFADSNDRQKDDFKPGPLVNPRPGFADSSLTSFLSRPRHVGTLTWSHGGILDSEINWLSTWAAATAVAAKLDNYHLIRAKYCVSVRSNATPFHQGMYMVKWMPNIYGNVGTTIVPSTADAVNNYVSQRPGSGPLDISESPAYDMSVPMVIPYDYMTVDDLNSEEPFGRVYIRGLAPLLTSNGNIVDAKLTIFVWLEDVELIVPTVAASEVVEKSPDQEVSELMNGVQSAVSNSKLVKEFLPDRIVSTTTSAIASAMGAFRDIPIIGPYASVGSVFLNKTSKVMHWFGLSRPSNVTDNVLSTIQISSSLSHVAGLDNTKSLTMDPKQAITIDPKSVGLPSYDQQSFKYICSRWTCVGTAVWNPSDVQNTVIFQAPVYPYVNNLEGLSSTGFVSSAFDYWTGSMEFMIVIAASKYNSGRLVLSYVPDGVSFQVPPFGVHNLAVVDLGETKVFKFGVGWAQQEAYKRLTSNTLGSVPRGNIVYNSSLFNGTLQVSVVNNLVSPANVSVDVHLFSRGGSDLAFAQPGKNFTDIHLWPQAASNILDPEPYLSADCYMSGSPDTRVADAKNLVYFGERIDSFRPLLKRYCHYLDYYNAQAGTTTATAAYVLPPMLPPGYDGTDLTSGSIPSVSGVTPLSTYVCTGYAGYRGSTRYKVMLASENGSNMPAHVLRSDDTPFVLPITTSALGFRTGAGGATGMELSSICVQPMLEWATPFYDNVKFRTTDVPSLASPPSDSYQCATVRLLQLRNSSDIFSMSIYVAAGDDFDTVLYTGGPTVRF